jgi:hypothetical protein
MSMDKDQAQGRIAAATRKEQKSDLAMPCSETLTPGSYTSFADLIGRDSDGLGRRRKTRWVDGIDGFGATTSTSGWSE